MWIERPSLRCIHYHWAELILHHPIRCFATRLSSPIGWCLSIALAIRWSWGSQSQWSSACWNGFPWLLHALHCWLALCTSKQITHDLCGSRDTNEIIKMLHSCERDIRLGDACIQPVRDFQWCPGVVARSIAFLHEWPLRCRPWRKGYRWGRSW